jgi:hypothetical protein
MTKRENIAEHESPEGCAAPVTSRRAPKEDQRTVKYKADDLPEALKLFMQVYAAL